MIPPPPVLVAQRQQALKQEELLQGRQNSLPMSPDPNFRDMRVPQGRPSRDALTREHYLALGGPSVDAGAAAGPLAEPLLLL